MRLSILGVYNVFYDVVCGNIFGLSIIAEDDAVTEGGEGHGVNVFVVGRVFAMDGGVALGTEDKILGGTRTCAVGYIFLSVGF